MNAIACHQTSASLSRWSLIITQKTPSVLVPELSSHGVALLNGFNVEALELDDGLVQLSELGHLGAL